MQGNIEKVRLSISCQNHGAAASARLLQLALACHPRSHTQHTERFSPLSSVCSSTQQCRDCGHEHGQLHPSCTCRLCFVSNTTQTDSKRIAGLVLCLRLRFCSFCTVRTTNALALANYAQRTNWRARISFTLLQCVGVARVDLYTSLEILARHVMLLTVTVHNHPQMTQRPCIEGIDL